MIELLFAIRLYILCIEEEQRIKRWLENMQPPSKSDKEEFGRKADSFLKSLSTH